MSIPSADKSVANIVDTIHAIAKGERPQSACIGIVVVPPPEIQVRANNIILTKEDIYIAEYLLIGYERTAKGHIKSATQNRAGGNGDAMYESHNHDIDNNYTDNIIYTDTLKKGDMVSLIPIEGDQLYILENKVVRL